MRCFAMPYTSPCLASQHGHTDPLGLDQSSLGDQDITSILGIKKVPKKIKNFWRMRSVWPRRESRPQTRIRACGGGFEHRWETGDSPRGVPPASPPSAVSFNG